MKSKHSLGCLLMVLAGVDLHAQNGPGTALSFDGGDQGARIPYMRVSSFWTNTTISEVTVEFWQREMDPSYSPDYVQTAGGGFNDRLVAGSYADNGSTN